MFNLYLNKKRNQVISYRKEFPFWSGKTFKYIFKKNAYFVKYIIILAPALFKDKLRKKNFKNYNIVSPRGTSYSADISLYLKILAPVTPFLLLKKKNFFFNNFTGTLLLWSVEFLDLLLLILYSTPVFFNTKVFDLSFFFNKNSYILYYLFKIPLFSTWLVVFIKFQKTFKKRSQCIKIISAESLFYSLSWIEREASELFGIHFTNKQTNRKLITDYFFKIYPMLKWVPSIGFSEVYVSSEGFFNNRRVKVFNSTLS